MTWFPIHWGALRRVSSRQDLRGTAPKRNLGETGVPPRLQPQEAETQIRRSLRAVRKHSHQIYENFEDGQLLANLLSGRKYGGKRYDHPPTSASASGPRPKGAAPPHGPTIDKLSSSTSGPGP